MSHRSGRRHLGISILGAGDRRQRRQRSGIHSPGHRVCVSFIRVGNIAPRTGGGLADHGVGFHAAREKLPDATRRTSVPSPFITKNSAMASPATLLDVHRPRPNAMRLSGDQVGDTSDIRPADADVRRVTPDPSTFTL